MNWPNTAIERVEAKVDMDPHAEHETATSATDGGTSDILTYAQTAQFLGVPIGTLYAWVHQRRIPHFRLSPRAVRFSRSALTGWLGRHAVAIG